MDCFLRQISNFAVSNLNDLKILRIKIVFCLLGLICMAQTMTAQITGEIVDASDGGPIPYASAVYRGNKSAVSSNAEGKFTIERHNGWRLTISSVGYIPQVINISSNTPSHLVVRLKPESKMLKEVTISSKRSTKYSRKNNPAVDLMRKVIAAKKESSTIIIGKSCWA